MKIFLPIILGLVLSHPSSAAPSFDTLAEPIRFSDRLSQATDQFQQKKSETESLYMSFEEIQSLLEDKGPNLYIVHFQSFVLDAVTTIFDVCHDEDSFKNIKTGKAIRKTFFRLHCDKAETQFIANKYLQACVSPREEEVAHSLNYTLQIVRHAIEAPYSAVYLEDIESGRNQSPRNLDDGLHEYLKLHERVFEENRGLPAFFRKYSTSSYYNDPIVPEDHRFRYRRYKFVKYSVPKCEK